MPNCHISSGLVMKISSSCTKSNQYRQLLLKQGQILLKYNGPPIACLWRWDMGCLCKFKFLPIYCICHSCAICNNMLFITTCYDDTKETTCLCLQDMKPSGNSFNVKTPSDHYRDSHYKDKMVIQERPSSYWDRNHRVKVIFWYGVDLLHLEWSPVWIDFVRKSLFQYF